jgi:hypothetical protein
LVVVFGGGDPAFDTFDDGLDVALGQHAETSSGHRRRVLICGT